MNFLTLAGGFCSTSPCRKPSTSMKLLSVFDSGWIRLSMSLLSSPFE